ncbi:oligopeptide transport ATP-binding protein AppF [Thermoclostridium stercorarium subsp. stercorarium DSM 8532]|uniref:Oligopeptide transport ATP-binding protein AppF n=3 Tax=Thermoclostridium stercorarium TaxID=1510 RepID=L7VMC1_THES1|nr:oligopeptide/dipeptide ABC transporter ATP-binding protein [Thermoclostridium stercorarium]AGC67897.1 oligopeptide transport ATP-binding protein AppF [Thermoclostridium stercorarium subsp. stercorarium DSM 8532]AGI38938.1 ABC transporter ATPase subunit [Thermoclostridium stercorarium subsp. stercorarium DSM 8532]ANW98307.1 peptide ABC transporter ATP-binding protein [Thermoclostridium stercorarium subsp. thermolacticum DSM 2910]ANX00833.1 peptide ABC transporter ATP-binding protein [Thermocl
MSEYILEVKNLYKEYTSKNITVKAVTDISFSIKKGETVGIVGESGCGKTTLGRCIVRAIPATSGQVLYTAEDGITYDFLSIDKKKLKELRKDIQMIFQDPYSSLDPRMTVLNIITEPLKANFPKMKKSEMEQRATEIAEKVGLNPSYLRRYPHAFSGGQRQRIGIARALVINPRIVVCDEPVSALDVSIQAQVINLLKDLQREFGLTYIFISHDLSVVEYISDKVGVMYLGKMVEFAETETLFSRPMHPYTEALLSSVPVADPTYKMNRIPLKGEIPNPANPPSGCYFHERCSYCKDICKKEPPEYREIEKDHFVACHRVEELKLRGFSYDEQRAI